MSFYQSTQRWVVMTTILCCASLWFVETPETRTSFLQDYTLECSIPGDTRETSLTGQAMIVIGEIGSHVQATHKTIVEISNSFLHMAHVV